MAGWISHNRPAEISYTEDFQRAGPSLGASWSFIQGTDGTDAQIKASSEAFEPSTAGIAPWAIFTKGLPDTSLRWRASGDMRIRDASDATNPGQHSRLSIHAFNPTTGVSRLLYAVRLLGVTTNIFRIEQFPGTITFGVPVQTSDVSYSPLSDVYYRVGLEAIDNTIRGYIVPTGSATATGDDTLLEPRVSLPYDPNLVGSSDLICVGILMTIAANGGPTEWSAFDNIKIERLPNDPFTGTFPGGTFFEAPDNPYAVYKSTLTLHDLFTQAKFT